MKLIESKSILAKLMATENITVEQRNTSTAYFDTNTRVLTVPILDNEIPAHTYDLFMGHEVGHALYTPNDEWMKTMESDIPKSYFNILEDSRIERKIRSKYPGLKSSFVRGYQDLMDRNFFGVNIDDINELNFIDRINMYEKCGPALGIEFDEDEGVLLREVQSTQTFGEVVELAKKIYDFMKERKEELNNSIQSVSYQQPEEDHDNETEAEDAGSGVSDTDTESEETEEQEEGDSSETEVQSEASKMDEEDASEKEDESLENEVGGENSNDADENDLNSVTDENYRRNESKLFSSEDTEFEYVNVPELILDNIILPYKKFYEQYKSFNGRYWYNNVATTDEEGFQKFKKESNKVVSYLVKEFELRKNADQMKRSSVSRTGELNMEKIFAYKFTDDIFKKMTIVPGAKSHGLIMYIDWSGSMHFHIHNTVKQLLNLVMFCKKVNIPYEVYAFREGNDKIVQNPKANDMMVNRFQLFNILSSKMTASEFSYAGSVLMWVSKNPKDIPSWMNMGSTPLNESIISAMQIVPEFKKQNNLQIVNTVFLTDGEGDYIDSAYDSGLHYKTLRNVKYLQNTLKQMKVVVNVRDPITKHQVKLSNLQSRIGQTTAFVELMKQRTHCNVMGFYVLSTAELKKYGKHFFKDYYEDFSNINRKFSTEKSLVSDKGAFDEYYLIKSDKSSWGDDEDEGVVIKSKTTKSLVTAFTKYNNNKVMSRSVLNRFIGMIA